MKLNDKIYVAGHRGLVGSAILRRLSRDGYVNVVTRTHAELDLTNQVAVEEFFAAEAPRYVFLAAAKVGGILANSALPADFIYQNLLIQANVIHQAYRSGVERLLFLGSSCIYPKHAAQPLKEEYLLTGSLEPTNEYYAIAKISGIKMCAAYNRQYGAQFLCAMPTNLYGIGDNYDLETSHVVPALIRKFHEAKDSSRVAGKSSPVVIWGTGTPRREFLFSDDLADASLFLMNLPRDKFQQLAGNREPPLVNVGIGTDIAIAELVEIIRGTVGYDGEVTYDANRPDGTPQKLLDISRLKALGWSATTSLTDGLRKTYEDFLARLNPPGHQGPSCFFVGV